MSGKLSQEIYPSGSDLYPDGCVVGSRYEHRSDFERTHEVCAHSYQPARVYDDDDCRCRLSCASPIQRPHHSLAQWDEVSFLLAEYRTRRDGVHPCGRRQLEGRRFALAVCFVRPDHRVGAGLHVL